MRRPAVMLLPALALLVLAGCGGTSQRGRTPDARPRAPHAESPIASERCTDIWIATSPQGYWGDWRNWSEHREPGWNDEACVPRGRTVTIASGMHQVGVLIDGGRLTITGGTLGFMDPSTASEVAHLRLKGGAYYGPGELLVSLSFKWTGGSMGGGYGPARAPGWPAPAAVTCGAHSPPLIMQCAKPDPAADRQIRAAWAGLFHLLQVGGPYREVRSLITTGACVLQGHPLPRTARARTAACHRAVHRILSVPSKTSVSPRLVRLVVDADRAYASNVAPGAGTVHFLRRRGRWRISGLFAYGAW